jgi:integrase/recombinase XerD
MLSQYCESLGIEADFTPHVLRHAYVDFALKNGGDLREVQAQMGHTNLRTTLRYAKGVSSKRLEHHLETSPRDLLF